MRLLALISLVLLYGCEKPANYVEQTDNNNFQVDYLFEKDGCKIYRFEDGGRYRYFTTCRGETMTTQRCGKNCTYQENIQTH